MSENTGFGSSGSWRSDQKDTTQSFKEGKSGSHDTAGSKLAAFEQSQKRHVHFQPIAVRSERSRKDAEEEAGLKPMRFVSLHHHSTFSFLDGLQMPEAHVRRATEIKMNAIAMTEHGNIFSHVKLEREAEKAGVQPIFGCEFYVGWTDEDRRTQKKNHITVIAKNMEGYLNLLTLVNKSWKEGFYHEPTVDWNWLVAHQKGLIVLSGCLGSALATACVGGKHVEESESSYRRGLKVARWLSDRFDDFYIEVQAFPELAKTRALNPMLARIAKQIHRPLVATMDCHYTIPEESEIQVVLHGVRPGEKRTAEELEFDWGYDVPLCPPPTDNSIWRRLVETGLNRDQAIEAIVSTEEIAQECKGLVLPKLPKVDFPLPEGYDNVTDYWRDQLRKGWDYRRVRELPQREIDRYREQLHREMEVIEAKGYENYFMIVQDAIVFAKEEQIPIGPARGSAAASLCCYLLRITEVNPMDYDYLVFERFIDWSREDMPDVDIDFATYGRPIVRDYLAGKYGEACVNNIGTFTGYKSKNSLGDAAKVHGVPKPKVEKVKELLLERSSGDLRASATIQDTVEQFDQAYEVFEEYPELQHSMDLEGNVKSFGVHAAGIVVSGEDIGNVCAVLHKEVPKGSGNWITAISMDMKDAERQGMEKLDFLALDAMDMIAEAMHLLDMTVEDLYAIPLDDPDVFAGFARNDVVGIFQFDGKITRTVNGVIKPDNFDEVATIIAIARPGPLHNGAVDGFVEVKYGDGSERESLHPAVDRITEVTNYQIILQEQIMRIVGEIGGFDWKGVGEIRKIIAKKKGEQEFNRKRDEFVEGAMKLHEREPDMPPIDEALADRIWSMCITSGAYAFNAAHSVAYGMISYWTMWLKVHHPAAFFAASLSVTDPNNDKAGYLRRDAMEHDIEVLPPGLDSEIKWSVVEDDAAVQAGWTSITGVGDKTGEKIVKCRTERGGFDDYDDLLAVDGIGPKTIEKIREFCEQDDPFHIYALDEAIAKIKEEIANGELDGLPMPTHDSKELLDAPGDEKMIFLGQPTHRNLRNKFEANQKKGKEFVPTKFDKEYPEWVVMRVRDGDDLVICIVPRKKYPRFKEAVWGIDLDKDLVLMECTKASFGGAGERSGVCFIDKMWVLTP